MFSIGSDGKGWEEGRDSERSVLVYLLVLYVD